MSRPDSHQDLDDDDGQAKADGKLRDERRRDGDDGDDEERRQVEIQAMTPRPSGASRVVVAQRTVQTARC
jgi:hypothetical protein